MRRWLQRGRPLRPAAPVRATRLFVGLLEERTVPTVALFDAAGQFVRNFAGADAVGQAIASGIANAHVIVYNDEVYSDFVADVPGQSILGRVVGGNDSTYPFQGDVNVSALGPAVTAKPTVQASGSGTTATLAADGVDVDNLDIRDGNGRNAVGLRATAGNVSISNSVIEHHPTGVVVAGGVNGFQITGCSITGAAGLESLAPGVSLDIESDIISTTAVGINVANAASVTVLGSQIVSSAGDAIDLLDISGAVQIGGPATGQGNAITAGPDGSGIFAVWANLFGSATTVQDNTVSGGDVGINIFNDQRGLITIGGPSAAEGNTVDGSETGIFVRISIGGLFVQNNVLTDIGTYGVRLSGTGMLVQSGIGTTTAPADVADNTMSSTSGDTGLVIDDGIQDQYHYYNNVTAERDTVVGFSTGVGITNKGTVSLDHVTVADADTGVDIDGENGAVAPLLVSVASGSVTARSRGIHFDGNGFGTGANGLTVSGVAITITGRDGIGVDLENTANAGLSGVTIDLPTTPGNTAIGIDVAGSELELDTGVSVNSGQTGLRVENVAPYYTAHLNGNTVSEMSFAGQTGNYVEIGAGALAGQELDATAASFDGFVVGRGAVPGDLSRFFAVEDKVADALDDSGGGLVRILPGHLFVTRQSELTAAGAIQRAVGTATAGDVIHIQAGSFHGATLEKPITLAGAGRPTITGSEATAAVEVPAGVAGVVIDGFAFGGSVGITVAGGAQIFNNAFTVGTVGIMVVAGGQATILANTLSGKPGTNHAGIVVAGTADLGDGTAAGVNGITGWTGVGSEAVLVTAGGAARLLRNTITGNGTGVLVGGGTALIQDNDLRNNLANGRNSAGLAVRNGAVVDAGQAAQGKRPAGTDFTGLGISHGGNRFNWSASPAGGYSQTGAKAIVNDNAYAGPPAGGGSLQPPDVTAEFNDFGTSVYGNIEQIVTHHLDAAGTAYVDYRNAVGAAAPALQILTPGAVNPYLLIYDTDPAAGPAAFVNQRSIIRAIQFRIDSPVVLGAGAVTLTRLGSTRYPWYGGSLLPVGVVPIGVTAGIDGGTGRTTVTVRFVAPNNGSFNGSTTEWGSLIDGNDTLDFHGSAADLLYVGSGTAAQNHADSLFRFYGDVTGNRLIGVGDVATMAQAIQAQLLHRPSALMALFDLNQNGRLDPLEVPITVAGFNGEFYRRLRGGGYLPPSP